MLRGPGFVRSWLALCTATGSALLSEPLNSLSNKGINNVA